MNDWHCPSGTVDVIVSNLLLPWVSDHLGLLPGLAEPVTPGGRPAFLLPGDLHEPSHTLLLALAAETPYAEHTADVAHQVAPRRRDLSPGPADLGCEVDAWETPHPHVLSGPDPVFTWVSGAGTRLTLQALPDDSRPQFEGELEKRLCEAYPSATASW